jgi:hypothetical protein
MSVEHSLSETVDWIDWYWYISDTDLTQDYRQKVFSEKYCTTISQTCEIFKSTGYKLPYHLQMVKTKEITKIGNWSLCMN